MSEPRNSRCTSDAAARWNTRLVRMRTTRSSGWSRSTSSSIVSTAALCREYVLVAMPVAGHLSSRRPDLGAGAVGAYGGGVDERAHPSIDHG